MKTTVRNWFDTRGFGFLRCPNQGPDIFAHKSDIVDGGASPRLLPDSEVECEVIQGARGRQAINIRLITHKP